MGSQPLLDQVMARRSSFPLGLAVPTCTSATHENSHGPLHRQPLPGLPPKLRGPKRMLFWEFLTRPPRARRFWGLERNMDSSTLVSPPSPWAAATAHCSPVHPTGNGLAPASWRPTGLRGHLMETGFPLRPAHTGSVALARAPGCRPQTRATGLFGTTSTWHLQ